MPPATRAPILRDIVGNPFRPVLLPWRCRECGIPCGLPAAGYYCVRCGCDEAQCPWRTPTVFSLAQAAYEERADNGTLDPLRLTVLADALEEAGCDSEDLLRHLRGLPDRLPCPQCKGTGQVRGTVRDLGRADEGYKTKTGTRPCHAYVLHDGVSYRRCQNGWVDIGESGTPHVRGCWVLDLLLGKE